MQAITSDMPELFAGTTATVPRPGTSTERKLKMTPGERNLPTLEVVTAAAQVSTAKVSRCGSHRQTKLLPNFGAGLQQGQVLEAADRPQV